MPVRNLHQKPFDEGTRDKLELYREYLREWLPVFINASALDIIQVFDFFAGPGFDVDENPGSPAITCDEIRNVIQSGKQHSKVIKAYFKELETAVFGRQLKTNKDVYLFALQNGMLASHARNGLELLIKGKKLPKQNLHVSYDAWKKPKVERVCFLKGGLS